MLPVVGTKPQNWYLTDKFITHIRIDCIIDC